jgi:hypothetical protein
LFTSTDTGRPWPRCRERGAQRLHVGDVALDELAPSASRVTSALRLVLGDVEEEHLRLLAHEALDHRLANAGAAAGDHDGLAGQRGINSVRHILS